MLNREQLIAEYDAHFLEHWNRAFEEVMCVQEDKVWFVGPTSYLFQINGLRFGVDLQIRRKSDFERLVPYLKEQLSRLSFVLITHEHEDHMCMPLIKLLKDTDLRWYFPHDCTRALVHATGLKEENITWLAPGDSFSACDVKITAFHTPHARPGTENVAQRGYFIEAPGGTVLIPGDIRDYGYDGYPHFGKVDLCISHLWAGDDAIHPEAYAPYLEQFTEHAARFGAKRYFLCHLYEIGRSEDKMWNEGHAGQVENLIRMKYPGCSVEVPKLGQRHTLWMKET